MSKDVDCTSDKVSWCADDICDGGSKVMILIVTMKMTNDLLQTADWLNKLITVINLLF